MNKSTVINTALHTVNLGCLIYGNHETKKSLKRQNQFAIGMVVMAVGVSLVNTAWIIKKVEES